MKNITARVQLQDVIKTTIIDQGVIYEMIGDGESIGEVKEFLGYDEDTFEAYDENGYTVFRYKDAFVYERNGHIIIKYTENITWDNVIKLREYVKSKLKAHLSSKLNGESATSIDDVVFSRISFTFAPSEFQGINERTYICVLPSKDENDKFNSMRNIFKPIKLNKMREYIEESGDTEAADLDEFGNIYLNRKLCNRFGWVIALSLIKKSSEVTTTEDGKEIVNTTVAFRIYISNVAYNNDFGSFKEFLSTYTFRIEKDSKGNEIIDIMKPIREKFKINYSIIDEIEQKIVKMSKLLLEEFKDDIDINEAFIQNNEGFTTNVINPNLIKYFKTQGFIDIKNRVSKFKYLEFPYTRKIGFNKGKRKDRERFKKEGVQQNKPVNIIPKPQINSIPPNKEAVTEADVV